jgi:hypothetical protein
MRSVQKLAIILGSGFALASQSAALTQAQPAKAAPAYVVLEFNIKDAEGFRDYAQRSPATVALHGGKFLVARQDRHLDWRRTKRGFRSSCLRQRGAGSEMGFFARVYCSGAAARQVGGGADLRSRGRGTLTSARRSGGGAITSLPHRPERPMGEGLQA